MPRRIKYIFPDELKNIPRDKGKAYLEETIFSSEHFAKHIEQVSINLKVDEAIVRDVLVSYFSNIFFMCNTVRKFKTKINLYGFCSIIVTKGRYF